MSVPQCFGLSSMCGDFRVLFMALFVLNSTRIAFRDRFLFLSHQACGQSRSKTGPGSPVRGQASRFACFPAVWPRKKSPAYGRGSHVKRLIEVKPFQ